MVTRATGKTMPNKRPRDRMASATRSTRELSCPCERITTISSVKREPPGRKFAKAFSRCAKGIRSRSMLSIKRRSCRPWATIVRWQKKCSISLGTLICPMFGANQSASFVPADGPERAHSNRTDCRLRSSVRRRIHNPHFAIANQQSLQPYNHGFGLGVEFQRFVSHLTAPAGLLVATEGKRGVKHVV